MSAAVETRSPWDEVRARHPEGTHLLRVIDVEKKLQRFDVLYPERGGSDLTDYDLDGCTLVMPAAHRTPEELAAIIAEYDAAWFARKE